MGRREGGGGREAVLEVSAALVVMLSVLPWRRFTRLACVCECHGWGCCCR